VGTGKQLLWWSVPAANLLTQNLATWEENIYFSLLCITFWFLFFLLFFKATIFIPCVQVTVLQAARLWRD
jgi:hypothetical protein